MVKSGGGRQGSTQQSYKLCKGGFDSHSPDHCLECAKILEGKQTMFCCPRHKSRWHSRERRKTGRDKIHIRLCQVCNNTFKTKYKTSIYCSNKCSGIAQRIGLDIPDYLENGSRKLDKNIGYVRVYCPKHPEANSWGYVYEHRVIAEKLLGRSLYSNEVVHHKNGKRWDNRESNLAVMDRIEHSKLK